MPSLLPIPIFIGDILILKQSSHPLKLTYNANIIFILYEVHFIHNPYSAYTIQGYNTTGCKAQDRIHSCPV